MKLKLKERWKDLIIFSSFIVMILSGSFYYSGWGNAPVVGSAFNVVSASISGVEEEPDEIYFNIQECDFKNRGSLVGDACQVIGTYDINDLYKDIGWVNISTGNISIAVIDNGAALENPNVIEHYVPAECVNQNPFDLKDGHGTMTLGIIPNILPDAKIINVKGMCNPEYKSNGILDCEDCTSTQSIMFDGFDWIRDNSERLNIRVISMSLSCYAPENCPLDGLSSKIKGLTDKGIVVVVAAGNCGRSTDCEPQAFCEKDIMFELARNPNVITVGAVGYPYGARYGEIQPVGYSTTGVGGKPDASFLTHFVYYDFKKNTMAIGTSASTPGVAAVVAAMLSVNPDLTTQEIKEILKDTAKDVGEFGFDDRTGAGLVQMDRAVAGAKQKTPEGKIAQAIFYVSSCGFLVSFGSFAVNTRNKRKK